MATCDSLQPLVLLTDIMDENNSESESVSVENTEEESSNSEVHLFQVEQTEPLNLCLNGTFINGFAVVQFYPHLKDNGNLSEQSDDDVIFVKEYKVNGEKAVKRPIGQKIISKEAPRRNPVRKARVSKRFEDYTDLSFEEGDFLEDSIEEEEAVDVSESFVPKNEDAEDWKIENVPKRSRQRRKVISRKMSRRLGRKRKNIKEKYDEKKVTFNDLESLIVSNLNLLKDYITDVRIVNSLAIGRENLQKSDRSKYALDIFKQQVVLLAVAKDVEEDIAKFITKL